MKVVIFPEPYYEGDKIFQPARNDWHLPFLEIRAQLQEKGHELVSYNGDPTSVDISHDVGLYCGIHNPAPTTEKSVCVQLEPPVTPGRARFYERIGGLPFTRTLTFIKDYVDGDRVHYDVLPYMPYSGELSPTRDKYICAVSGGGKDFPSVTIDGKVWESLFSARRLAYLSFGKDIDVYGTGWEKDKEIMDVCNYKGQCDNKIKTMSQYKYAIVFENTLDCYTSEKYWDGIQSGCNMLYRGQWPTYSADFADYRNWATRIVKHLEDVA